MLEPKGFAHANLVIPDWQSLFFFFRLVILSPSIVRVWAGRENDFAMRLTVDRD